METRSSTFDMLSTVLNLTQLEVGIRKVVKRIRARTQITDVACANPNLQTRWILNMNEAFTNKIS